MTRSTTLKILLLALFVACPSTARADFRLERTLDLGPGGELVVDADGGHIYVRGGSDGGAQVLITSSRSSVEDRYRFHLDGDGRRAVVKANRRGLSWFSWGSDAIEIEVIVPLETSVRLDTSGGKIELEGITGTAFVDTSGGRIEIYDVRGDVDAHTSGGAISVEKVVGDLVVDTSGGSISVEAVTGFVKADTSGGSVSIEEVGGRVHARSSGGSIEVRFAAGNAEGGDLSTSGGTVTAYVDPSAGLDVDASTSGGRVSFDVDVRGQISKRSVRGAMNGGGASLRMRSSGGSVRIKTL